jgi:hypothetical protein
MWEIEHAAHLHFSEMPQNHRSRRTVFQKGRASCETWARVQKVSAHESLWMRSTKMNIEKPELLRGLFFHFEASERTLPDYDTPS